MRHIKALPEPCVIWKAIFQFAGVQDLSIPVGAEILCVRVQFGDVCLWFKCNPTAPKELRRFALIATGQSAPRDDAIYLDTVFLSGGALVYHIFEQAFA